MGVDKLYNVIPTVSYDIDPWFLLQGTNRFMVLGLVKSTLMIIPPGSYPTIPICVAPFGEHQEYKADINLCSCLSLTFLGLLIIIGSNGPSYYPLDRTSVRYILSS